MESGSLTINFFEEVCFGPVMKTSYKIYPKTSKFSKNQIILITFILSQLNFFFALHYNFDINIRALVLRSQHNLRKSTNYTSKFSARSFSSLSIVVPRFSKSCSLKPIVVRKIGHFETLFFTTLRCKFQSIFQTKPDPAWYQSGACRLGWQWRSDQFHRFSLFLKKPLPFLFFAFNCPVSLSWTPPFSAHFQFTLVWLKMVFSFDGTF